LLQCYTQEEIADKIRLSRSRVSSAFQCLTQEKIANKIGISQGRVAQIISKFVSEEINDILSLANPIKGEGGVGSNEHTLPSFEGKEPLLLSSLHLFKKILA